MREAWLIVLVLSAGCVNAPASELETATNATDEARGAEPTPSGPPVAPANGTSMTTAGAGGATTLNLTSFVWRSSRHLGDLALSFRVAAANASGEATKCDLDRAMGYDGARPGMNFLSLTIKDGALIGVGGGGSGALAHAHVDGTSTSGATGDTASGASGHGSGVTVDAAGVEIVLAAASTAPAEAEFVEQGSVLVNLTCEGPIVVSDFAYSHEIALFRSGFGSQGAGASAFFAGSAGFRERVLLDAVSPRVVAAIQSSGVGQVSISGPDGAVTTTSTPVDPARVLVDGGPGAWSLGVEASVGILPAYGGILGLMPIASWDDIPAADG